MSQRILHRYHGRLTTAHVRSGIKASTVENGLTFCIKSHVQRTSYASEASAATAAKASNGSSTASSYVANLPMGHGAKQKLADREFFADLLGSAATKRDAKVYISRLKSPKKTKPTLKNMNTSKSNVNLGDLFGRPRAVDASPRFAQHDLADIGFEEQETLHVALVKIRGIDKMSNKTVHGIAQTLSQLSRLSMAPCVVVEAGNPGDSQSRYELVSQADRLAAAIDQVSDKGARVVDNILTMSASGKPEVALRRLLLRPLRSGHVSIVVPTACSEQQQQFIPVAATDAVLALTREFAGQNPNFREVYGDQGLVSLDRVIIVDEAGGIPNVVSGDGTHVFINMKQEYPVIMDQLMQSQTKNFSTHQKNLQLLQDALELLPQASSGLITTPGQAANYDHEEDSPLLASSASPSMVGTRRQKNTLIHNLLTDKPAYSSSLPRTRLSKNPHSPIMVPTFAKRGMPLLASPDPSVVAWTATAPRIKLTDSEIDLKKLAFLIDDSFNRELDVEAYLKRVNDRIAGVIIAGDYEGGAILTWETPSGVDPEDLSRQVPYLDKFAVLKRSQGAGGVADIVFNSMVGSCFPNGVCWRSRKGNPVNKWYFERSVGTWKIPDMNWTMFWTTPGVASDSQTFKDYEAVCRGVEPTWVNKKMAAD